MPLTVTAYMPDLAQDQVYTTSRQAEEADLRYVADTIAHVGPRMLQILSGEEPTNYDDLRRVLQWADRRLQRLEWDRPQPAPETSPNVVSADRLVAATMTEDELREHVAPGSTDSTQF